MNVFQIEKEPTLASIVKEISKKVNQYDSVSEYFSVKVYNMFKAGYTSGEISKHMECRVAKVNSVIESFRGLFKVEQVSFGRKNEPYTEDSLMGILPKYNSYELKGEEAEMFFLEDSPFKFKLEYEKE